MISKKLFLTFRILKAFSFVFLILSYSTLFFSSVHSKEIQNPVNPSDSLPKSSPDSGLPASLPTTLSDSKTTILIEIDKQIDPGLSLYLQRAISEAIKQKPDLILFKINTFGGRLDAAFDIVDQIVKIEKIETVAYVHDKAISAGALISLACNRIVMGKGTTIGDCAPIIQGKEGIIMAGEKIESPLRAKFRNLAEKNGYPVLLAQAMVSMDMEVLYVKENDKWTYITRQDYDDMSEENRKKITEKKTVDKKGELLTLTNTEAETYGFSKGTFESVEDYIEKNNLKLMDKIKANWSEELVRTIGMFAPILMMIGFGALYMEFKTPGFGLFGIIGITALIIVFGGKYAAGLANYTELLIFGLGVLLFLLEIFVMPGTFIFGALGISTIIISLVLSMQNFSIPDPTLPWQKKALIDNILNVLTFAFVSLLIPFFAAKYILPRFKGSYELISQGTLKDAHVTAPNDNAIGVKVGDRGIALSMLRPTGKIFIRDHKMDGDAESGYISQGAEIEVTGIVDNQIMVKEIHPHKEEV